MDDMVDWLSSVHHNLRLRRKPTSEPKELQRKGNRKVDLRVRVLSAIDGISERAAHDLLKEFGSIPRLLRSRTSQRKLMEIEGVNLRLTDSALTAIAEEAMKRKSGARGLRAIMEKCMIDVMYEIPSMENVKECVIGEDTVLNQEDPILLFEQPQKKAQDG